MWLLQFVGELLRDIVVVECCRRPCGHLSETVLVIYCLTFGGGSVRRESERKWK